MTFCKEPVLNFLCSWKNTATKLYWAKHRSFNSRRNNSTLGTPRTWNNIKIHIEFVQGSAVLENHFNRKCLNGFNLSKKAGKGAYFRQLGYSAWFAPGSKPVGKAVEIKRRQEMKGAYMKLFNLNCSKTRDTSNWRKALFNDVCSENLKTCRKNSTQCPPVYNHFAFGEDWMAFGKFCRTAFTNESETLLSFLAMLDAVVTDTVDSFKFTI